MARFSRRIAPWACVRLSMRVSKSAAAVFAAMVSLTGLALGQNPSARMRRRRALRKQESRALNVTPREPSVLSGSVVDPNGGAVPGATVTIINVEEQGDKTTTTNETGRFKFASIAWNYSTSQIEANGFKSLQIMTVSSQQTRSLTSKVSSRYRTST